ncbi:hypothetical protein JTB14_028002 [Gonioctena quinquepunctata]|nr:hypothetical protein JTB14_028002 [Gonioctena quinquepunctata]
MLNMNKRTGNLSSAQKTELLEFLERNPALQIGKFSNDFTFKKAQGMWMEVSNTLNSLPVTHKDWRQWRKRGTGGGPPILPPLNENEEAIVQMIGTVATEGHPKILESDTLFENGVCQEVDYTTLHYMNLIMITMQENRVERLNHTIAATEKLAMHSEINIKQTEVYQKKKLKLYGEDIQAKNRIAAALENIAVYLSELKE